MAISHPIGARAPWYARTASTAGRPIVLAVTLLMCAPGEYHLARLAGWSDPFAYGMPFALSAYAGIAAVVAASRPKGARGRISAIAGAALAIVAALAAQVVSHLITTGHMVAAQAWLVAIVSAVPPAVVGHLLHLAASPAARTEADPTPPALQPVAERAEQPLTPVTTPADALPTTIPPMPALPPVTLAAEPEPWQAAPVIYTDERCAAIRPLYNTGFRPGTSTMRRALVAAGHAPGSDGTIRGTLRTEVERHEPHLAQLPAEVIQLTAP